MMVRRPIAFLLALGLLASAPPSARAAFSPDLAVTLSPRLERDTLRAVRVEVHFDGELDGETVVALPSEWGGQSALWRCLRGLEAIGARVAPGPDSSRIVLRHAPGAAVTLRYDVVQDWPGELRASERNPYRPVVQPGWFHLLGEATFALPERDDSTRVAFRWGPLPRGWTVASDVEHARPGRPLRIRDLVESVIVGGDFRVVTRRHPGGDLRLALRGTWSFRDDSLADRIDRIVQAHRRWWHDPDEPFLVTLLPLLAQPGNSSLGGTGRSDAFAFFATDNATEATLNRVLAHEHLHTWIPRRVGRLPRVDEPSGYWFSEGFTDFYTFRLLVREGLWSVRDFVDAANEVLQKYAQSPVRTAPNARIVEAFWTDRDAQDLPYQRGFLLATRWDDALRRASGGRLDLDDVMMEMKRRAAAATGRDSVPEVGPGLLAAARGLGLDLAADFGTYVEHGDAVAARTIACPRRGHARSHRATGARRRRASAAESPAAPP